MMMSRSKAKEEKSQLIINTALKVFSEKGYDNATIADIAKSAKVSMGLPLYYFTNKEELACQALEFSSKQITHSILKDITGNSPEEIAESFMNSFKKNIKIADLRKIKTRRQFKDLLSFCKENIIVLDEFDHLISSMTLLDKRTELSILLDNMGNAKDDESKKNLNEKYKFIHLIIFSVSCKYF